jgi:hypothetical protein
MAGAILCAGHFFVMILIYFGFSPACYSFRPIVKRSHGAVSLHQILIPENDMSTLRLTASQWIEKYRHGAAATCDGRRQLLAHEESTGEATYIEVDVEEPDLRCAVVDGRLDAEDMARVLAGFRGQPIALTPALRYVRTSADGVAAAYVFDEESGMVYILD